MLKNSPYRLLGAEDRAPVTVERLDGASALFMTCDHAGREIPKRLGDLGVPEAELRRHIAWDIGAEGVAPLVAPPDGEKGRRAVSAADEEMYGWRPAIGQPIPRLDHWLLERRLGEGGFGEVWLACHEKTRTHRVFKFCYDADRLRSFKRELTLFRLLRSTIGDRPDIAKIHDIQFDRPPEQLPRLEIFRAPVLSKKRAAPQHVVIGLKVAGRLGERALLLCLGQPDR